MIFIPYNVELSALVTAEDAIYSGAIWPRDRRDIADERFDKNENVYYRDKFIARRGGGITIQGKNYISLIAESDARGEAPSRSRHALSLSLSLLSSRISFANEIANR